MPVDKFGRRVAVQENVSSDVSFTQIGDYFSRRDGSNTANTCLLISLEGEWQFKKMFHQMYRLHRSVITVRKLEIPRFRGVFSTRQFTVRT